MGGSPIGVDRGTLNWVVDHRAGWLTDAMKVITFGGSTLFLTGLVLAAVIAFSAWWRPVSAVMIGVGSFGGYWVMVALKNMVDRDRPPDAVALVQHDSAAFPSGHAMMSAIVLGLIAVALYRDVDAVRNRWWPLLAAPAAGLIGLSRIYLAAHWLTDVLAGWLIGGLWVVLMAKATRTFVQWKSGGHRKMVD